MLNEWSFFYNSITTEIQDLRVANMSVKSYSTKLILLSLLLTFTGWAKVVTVQGKGIGINPKKALLEAKRDALSKGIGQVLVSQTEVKNFMIKKDHILTKTMGYVKGFKKLSETKSNDGLWEVSIEAKVNTGGLKDDVTSILMLMKDLGNPRIAFLIQETNMGTKDPDKHKTTEIALTEFFNSKELLFGLYPCIKSSYE